MSNIQQHNIDPVFDNNSKILILGSFPSVKSRESHYFYGHPQNRFWRVIAKIYDGAVPTTVEEKTRFLKGQGIALWDVIASCMIIGSSDSSISSVTVNDIELILKNSKVEKIFCNGNTSYNMYCKYLRSKTGINAIKLPSTSPANATYSFERLCERWRIIREANR